MKSGSHHSSLLLVILFLFSLVVLFIKDELFFSQFNGSLFISTPEYFKSFLNKPGGLVLYTGNYLIQFYRYGIAGPIILSSLFLIIFLVHDRITLSLSWSKIRQFIFIPSGLMLALQTSMDYQISNSLGYILSLVFFMLFIHMRKHIVITYLILFPLVFVVTGFFSFIFAGMIVTFILMEPGKEHKKLFAGTIIILTIVLPVLSKHLIYLQPWENIFLSPLQLPSTAINQIILIIVIGFSVLLPYVLSFNRGIKINEAGAYPIILLAGLVTCITWLIHSKDEGKLRATRIEKSVYIKDWESIINDHYSDPSNKMIDEHFFYLALANKKVLCDSLFRTGHINGVNILVLPRERKYDSRQIYYYYHLGLTREVHHIAYELMVNNGFTPEILKFLIETNIILREYALAQKYTNILNETCLETALNKYNMYLKDTAMINSDPELLHQRELLPKNDFFIRSDAMQNLELTLLSNPENVIALQYKIAILLLSRELESIRYEVDNIKNAGFMNIPLHMEEALLLDSLYRPDLYANGISLIRSETVVRFRRYIDETAKYRFSGSLPLDVKKRWDNTYWYYFDFDKP